MFRSFFVCSGFQGCQRGGLGFTTAWVLGSPFAEGCAGFLGGILFGSGGALCRPPALYRRWFEAKFLQFLGTPSIPGGLHVGALVIAFGGNKLVPQLGDSLAALHQGSDGFNAGVQQRAGLVSCLFNVEGSHGFSLTIIPTPAPADAPILA